MATRKTTTKVENKTEKVDTTVSSESVAETVGNQKIQEAEEKPIVPKNIDPMTLVVVKSGFHGRLVYISPRTKEKYVWEEFGDEQEIELRELRNAKSSAKKLFENNWFMFDEDNSWVIPYLGLGKFYKNALKLDEFDDVFKKSPEEITDIIEKLSSGQKKSLSYMARRLVADGEIDSRKVISALEEALGIELIER